MEKIDWTDYAFKFQALLLSQQLITHYHDGMDALTSCSHCGYRFEVHSLALTTAGVFLKVRPEQGTQY